MAQSSFVCFVGGNLAANTSHRSHVFMLPRTVNKLDASKVEQELDKFAKWEEGAEVTHAKRIPIKKLSDFLDHLLDTYRDSGITEADRHKWNGVNYAEEWTTKIVEWKFNADSADSSGVQGARFGIVGFAKSADGKYVDCMLAIYKLDFRLSPKLVIKENAILWGLYVWSTVDKEEIDRSISREEIAKFQNFFRYKALNEFKKEGVIDQISYTDRLEYKSKK
ncbi:uncharacterized protein LOC133174966 [Saccostrea echinata]|uniref:uncharacterized protein LOC133174966 n=1 Tax=Saccostrea echinata TaxID=191078 RepID=UPI002A82CAE2|nr:uncharacterized protein LOC133174966 [Saccostrea echinata]